METKKRIEPARPEPSDKVVRIHHDIHRKAKAAAALEDKDLRVWVMETLKDRLDQIEKREPACVRK